VRDSGPECDDLMTCRLMLPTFGGHLDRSILFRMEVLHGTQAA